MDSFENQDSDSSKTRQFSHSQSHLVSGETHDQTSNKNIEDLQNLRNSKSSFDEIYDKLNCIATENDFYAMKYAVQEKFFEMKNTNGETILDRSIKMCNYHLTSILIEFGVNNNHFHAFLNVCEFMRFILKNNFLMLIKF